MTSIILEMNYVKELQNISSFQNKKQQCIKTYKEKHFREKIRRELH
jgi:hypothetical protein